MKRIHELVKPFLSIIFGALLLLFYLNWLQGSGVTLAIGIVATVIAAWFLAVGILRITIGHQLSKNLLKTFDIASIVLFAGFSFTFFLLRVINMYDGAGPNFWVINILSLVASIGLVFVALIAFFADSSGAKRLLQLFAMIFVLILLVDIIFDDNGDPRNLGVINILETVLYIAFSGLLFNVVSDVTVAPKAAPAVEEKEEAPVEEAPAEEEKAE